ncbi:MAG: hypothetical protein PHI37_00595 [Candidatus Gracilibacteria bacterium]|nr:hypothetical protein [Candidatus Gracilibacteria bacterium]
MKIYLQKEAKKYDLTQEILNKLSSFEVIEYDKYSDIKKDIFLNIGDNFNIIFDNYKTNLEKRKDYLFLKSGKDLISRDDKGFTSFEIYRKLGYAIYNLKIGQNCLLGCDYCYLLSTNKFNPEITIYSNIKEEVNKFIKQNPGKKILFNIGEYTDSFLFDKITNLNQFFYEICIKNPNIIVESRTKLMNLDIKFPPIKNLILGFSISINNMDRFGKKEDILKKLEYIKELTYKGYIVSLKFDPIITLNGYDNDFFDVINNMKKDNIHHFSLGTLRFTRNLGKIIGNCTDSKKVNEEFILENGKYVNKYREAIYNFFIQKMGDIGVNDYYLSMDPK